MPSQRVEASRSDETRRCQNIGHCKLPRSEPQMHLRYINRGTTSAFILPHAVTILRVSAVQVVATATHTRSSAQVTQYHER